MAVLNIRIEDRVHDQLKQMADAEGVSLSEFVRDRIMETVTPLYEPDLDDQMRDGGHGDEPAIASMRIEHRQVLSMLHRILGRVLPEDANDVDGDLEYQLMRAKILEEGYSGEYWYETAGFRRELTKRDCARVTDILQMFRIATYSIDELAKAGTPVGPELVRSLRFQGFDFNDALEGHMADYIEFLMRDGRQWTELKPQIEHTDGGNSHTPMLDTYLRMLTEHRRIKDSRERGYGRNAYLLTAEELQRIADARIHPSRRDQP